MRKIMFLIALLVGISSLQAQDLMVVKDNNGSMNSFKIDNVEDITFGTNSMEAVDLGLTSGTLWASCNLGAFYPQDYGDFFAWGETLTKTSFTQQNYAYYSNNSYTNIGADIAATKYDAASATYGVQWAIPTTAQARELLDECTWTWVQYDKINGCKVTGPNGKSIFLPATGNIWNGTQHDNETTNGFIWTSDTASATQATYLGFWQNGTTLSPMTRDMGFTIRPVVHQSQTVNKSLTVSSTTTGVKVNYIGTELDPHFLSACLYKNDGAKREDWYNVIVPRVKKMGIQNIRVMLLPTWWEPVNDNDDPDSVNWDALTLSSDEMNSVYAVLDMAEELNIKVTLCFWGCPSGHFLANGRTDGWVVPSSLHDEWAESFAMIVKYLIDTRHYTCIENLTPINEPNSYSGSSSYMSASDYSDLCHKLDQQLKNMGVRDKVKLCLSDNLQQDLTFLNNTVRECDDIADAYNSHCYAYGYEDNNAVITNWAKVYSNAPRRLGKVQFVGEFGSNQTVGSSRQKDIDFYTRGVLVDRLAINFLNGGCGGVSYWQLFDEWYSKNDSYSAMQQLGMWKYVKDVYANESYFNKIKYDYEPRPQYYAYSLLTRFIRLGAEVHPISTGVDKLAATAIKNTDGKWVYVFANQEQDNYRIYLNHGDETAAGTYDLYRYAAGELPYDDSMLEPVDTVTSVDGASELSLPSQTVVLLRQR